MVGKGKKIYVGVSGGKPKNPTSIIYLGGKKRNSNIHNFTQKEITVPKER